MLKFIKNLFAQEVKQEEKINLDDLNHWLDEKAKPISESLKIEINNAINLINDSKEKMLESIKRLENAKLQNPNIPNRAKTIMEGNRAAFMKKTSHLLNNLDLGYEDYDEHLKKCDSIIEEIILLEKSSARSYQILKEFFAREVEDIAINIKKIEKNIKELKAKIKDNKLWNINEIKNEILHVQGKISSKESFRNDLEVERKNLENKKKDLDKIEIKIKEHKNQADYKNFENLLKEKETLNKELKEIEGILFHDFSVLEKALKKYAKIAFENEDLIEGYIKNSLNALLKDDNLGIIKILENLKKSIKDNKLGLEEKKSEKSLKKIDELTKEYFANLQNSCRTIKSRLNKINAEIEVDKAKKQLGNYNKNLNDAKNNLDIVKNKIFTLNTEMEKINIENLKQSLQEKINNALDERVIIL